MARPGRAKGFSAKSRGTRRSMGKTVATRGRTVSMKFGRGGGRHGPSIKKDDTYEALRRKGYSKSKAARIANAQANGTINNRGRRGPSRKR